MGIERTNIADVCDAERLPAIRACLFDMDGLLIDSEDLYTICTNQVLHEHGKGDLPWSIKAQLQGRPGPDVCHKTSCLYTRYMLYPTQPFQNRNIN